MIEVRLVKLEIQNTNLSNFDKILNIFQNPQLAEATVYIAGLILIGVFALFFTVFRRKSKHKIYTKQSKKEFKKIALMPPATKIAYLRTINPYVFEELILTALEQHGYRIARGTKYSGDGGIDGHVRIDGKWCLIQAKRYSNHVKADHIYEFDKVCRIHKTRGFFIHTGKTSKRLNLLTNSKIVSGDKMLRLFSSKETQFSF